MLIYNFGANIKLIKIKLISRRKVYINMAQFLKTGSVYVNINKFACGMIVAAKIQLM